MSLKLTGRQLIAGNWVAGGGKTLRPAAPTHAPRQM